MFKRLKFGILLCSILILNGCVGFQTTMEKKRRSVIHPIILPELGELKSSRPMWFPYTPSAKLVSRWGEPDSIEITTDGHEKWTYNRELSWGGIYVYLVLPIPLPLLLPVGYSKTILTLDEDGIVIKGEYYDRDIEDSYIYTPFEHLAPQFPF